jgi:hypothetical protein
MTRGVPVLPGLADLPPGPELGALLAGIDVSLVPNEEIVQVLRAESRQLAHQQGRVFAVMAEVGRCERLDPGRAVARAARPVVESIHEIGAALAVTSSAAFAEHDLAEQLRTRLPEVQGALLAGLVDRSKARLFAEYTRELTESQIVRICAQLLPVAPRLTTGQLADRLRRLVFSIDPEALRRRYEKAVRSRAVFGYLDRDGTATVGASGLSPDEAAASCARVYELARTVRRAGHPGPLSRIRADIFVALLDGSLQQMTNAQIVMALLARREGQEIAVAGAEQDQPEPAPEPDSDRPPVPAPSPVPAPLPAPDPSSAPDPAPHPAAAPEPAPDPVPDLPPAPVPSPAPDPAAHPAPVPAPAGSSVPVRVPEEPRGGIEVRVRLSTLLGLDEHAGEIPGWGSIPPQPAREVVARQLAGRWRFAITDAEGYLLLAGVTRRRPAAIGEVVQNAGGSVELQVPVELLRRLAAEPPAGWELVIADLATQYLQRDELLAILRAHPAARFPHAALRRHIEVRDRTCVFPGCRRPAVAAQMDHTVEYRDGGATVEANVGPLCFPHHWLKSTGGWCLQQPLPGRFTWRSPLGSTYRTRGEPIAPPLPEPVPGEPELDDEETCRWVETFHQTDDDRPPDFGPPRPRPRHEPPPRPEPPPLDAPDLDPPPF